jgi:hypothetical protein
MKQFYIPPPSGIHHRTLLCQNRSTLQDVFRRGLGCLLLPGSLYPNMIASSYDEMPTKNGRRSHTTENNEYSQVTQPAVGNYERRRGNKKIKLYIETAKKCCMWEVFISNWMIIPTYNLFVCCIFKHSLFQNCNWETLRIEALYIEGWVYSYHLKTAHILCPVAKMVQYLNESSHFVPAIKKQTGIQMVRRY